jgi:hypothetical protein
MDTAILQLNSMKNNTLRLCYIGNIQWLCYSTSLLFQHALP